MRDFVTNIAIVFQSVGSLLFYFAVHVYHVFVYMSLSNGKAPGSDGIPAEV